MSDDDPLVIHDGLLIPASEARPLLTEELSQHGYSLETIEGCLSRAIKATAALLSTMADYPPEVRETQLGFALLAERRVAERWRTQWEGEKRHADPQYKTDYQAQSQRYQQGHEEMLRQASLRAEYEQQQAEYRKRRRALDQFEHWEEHNRRVDEWNAQAEARAAERKLEDDRMTYALMKHIKEKEERAFWRISTEDEALNLIGDHEYIEWMFACFTRPSRRWLAIL